MPYSGISDSSLPAPVRGLPKRLREVWVKVFNETHAAGDEGKAYRAAWAATRAAQKATEKERSMSNTKPVGAVPPGGETAPITEKAAKKTEGGEQFGPEAYLYVPNPDEKPSDWKLRIEESPGKVTVAQLGRAAAALGPGFRGQKVELSEADAKKAAGKLISLYQDNKVADADIPDYLWGIAGQKAPKAKALDLGDWAYAVRDAMQVALPALWPVEIYDAYVIAVEAPPMPDSLAVDVLGVVAPIEQPASVEGPVAVGGPEASIDKLWKIPYTTTLRAVAGTDVKVIETVTFAPQADWVRVIEGFSEFKMLDEAGGRTRWTMVSSGGFEDGDREIVSTPFLESAVKAADVLGDRGPLRIFHVPGADIGECDFQAVVGKPGFLLESGTFNDDEDGRRAAAYYRAHAKEYGASIKFLYKTKSDDGVILPPGLIIERSLLPKSRAAFPYSGIAIQETTTMAAITKEKMDELVAVLGEERAQEIVGQLEQNAESLKAIGIRFKELKVPSEDEKQESTPASAHGEAAAPGPLSQQATAGEKAAAVLPVAEPTPPVLEALEAVSLPEEWSLTLSPEAIASISKEVGDGLEGKVLDPLRQFGERLDTLQAAVSQLSAAIQGLKVSDEERLAEKAANMPRATIRRLQRPSQDNPTVGEQTQTSLADVGHKTLYG